MRSRSARAGVLAALALALSAGGGLWTVPDLAHAAAPVPSCNEDPDQSATVSGDINGDGAADVVVGVPNLFFFGHTDVGEVDLHLSDGGRQRVSLDTISGSGGEHGGARFGAAVTAPDIDGDHCADLAVGVPGFDGRGAVYLLPGSRAGITATGGVPISAPDGAAGDDFGAAVVAAPSQAGGIDLWIGAPGRTVSGRAAAGAVYHYTVSPGFAPRLVREVSYGVPGIPGDPAAGDRFGAVLGYASGHAVVGVPRRAVGGEAEAGEVVTLTDAAGTLTAQVLSQDSPGVPGKAEAGDEFGAALSGAYVGVPGEDLGSAEDAGMVQLFALQGSTFGFVRSVTQDSPGVPGRAETGDRFGAALAGGTWFLCQEEGDLAIGAPGESVGSAAGAGSVTLVGVQSEAVPCPSRVLTQGGSLPGQLAAGNHVGARLAALSGNQDDDEDYRSGLVTAAPGTTTTVRHTGAVLTGLNRNGSSLGAIGGDVADQEFGSVLATPLG